MQQSDYNSIPYTQYPPNPNHVPTSTPNFLDHHHHHPPPPPQQSSYASAPPFAAGYPPASDYYSYSSSYPPHPQHPDAIPTTPSPNFQSYNPQPPPPQPQQAQPPATFPRYEASGDYQPPSQPKSLYPLYDQTPSYVPPIQSQTPNSSYPSIYPSQYNNQLSSEQEVMYNNIIKFDQPRGYVDETAGRYGSYGSGRAELGHHYGKRPERQYGIEDDGDGVYAYKGSKAEPYGARGTAPGSSTWSSFDDFGRPIGHSSEKNRPLGLTTKTVRAVPKAETQHDANAGVQKFRVKLLAESGGQNTQDVLCQIGLDGIRMLDPSTSRTLRIYPLDTITGCEVFDSSTMAFWSKSTVDIEPRRIRLKSNSYTTTTLLDTVTAATIQFKEIGGRSRPAESHKVAEQSGEKKKGLGDWLNVMKPVNEEKDHWVPDEAVSKCTACGADFNAFNRKHHCRNCGDIFCDKCTQARIALTADENSPIVRVCDRCKAEVSRRLSNAKEAASRSTVSESHEDLAKKLQEEMERNCKISSGSTRSELGRRMKEVACPTCTVHLQVQVPSSGSETIECGVCQHPFIVTAH
ncbi:unnamed protein product [Cuscuta epithymum]|uniref:FYVE-type domain-containing protein n=1 Tax=Cuscuta epithymum TaxID=186058 RepID=A0AAV0C7T1_9ASTE|nr:unnamed protein product [Cuscuta epithymum]